MLALMMQYVISAKAGLVNYVQGLSNVRPNQTVAEMTPIRTGPNGVIELLLTPGSYLRLGPNSEATIENSDIANVHVRLNNGEAIIEVVEIDNHFPMLISAGKTSVELGDAGIFRFKDGTVSVLEGKLKTVGERSTSYKKGWEVVYDLTYRARKAPPVQTSSLDMFSEKRSGILAAASASLVATVRRTSYNVGNPFWLYSPTLGAYSYVPLRDCRSPYGFRYTGYGVVYANGNLNTASNEGGSSNTPSNTSSNSSGGSSSPAPNVNSAGERTYQAPGGGGRVTAGEYQERKNPVAPPAP